MGRLSEDLKNCANASCNKHCRYFDYQSGCRTKLMLDAAKALEEWDKYTGFLAVHGMVESIEIPNEEQSDGDIH